VAEGVAGGSDGAVVASVYSYAMLATRPTSPVTMALALGAILVAAACGDSSGGQHDGGQPVDATAPNPWPVQTVPAQAQVWALYGVGADLYVAGDNGRIMRSADAAGTWTDVSVAPATVGATVVTYPQFFGIGASATDDVWVAGAASSSSGVLVHTTDRGQSWQPVGLGTSSVSYAVWPLDRDRVLVPTPDGQILVTADGGAHWTAAFSDPRMMLFAIWGSGGGDMYVVGGVAIGVDGGVGADASDDGSAPDGGAAAPTAYSGVVLRSSDGGASWQTVPNAATVCPLWHVSGTRDGAIVYAVGDCGSVAQTSDHGATWSTSGAASAGQDFGISGVWVSPNGTSYLLPSGRGYANFTSLGDESVCRSVTVEDDGSLIGLGGCDLLPPDKGFNASPIGIWGTSDNNVWILSAGATLWHHS
jgi:photosystem II stability/assembly factor-like uncharacterized protein